METREMAIKGDRELAIYELETQFAIAVRQRSLLENYIRERLKPDKHFYTISDEPDRKPSLTKEGAELICLPHALKGRYEWIAGPEYPPLDDTPFQITMKCILENNGKFAGEGLGSASSMITKKDGNRVQRQKDPGLRHNATIKMACKSAYIAATLNGTAASEFFTQDLEDDQTGSFSEKEVDKTQHWCSLHNTAFFKKGKMKAYAHPIKDDKGNDTGNWCHEHIEKQQAPEPDKPGEFTKVQPEQESKEGTEKIDSEIDPDRLKESMKKIHWAETTCLSWIKGKANYTGLDFSGKLTDVINRMNAEQLKFLLGEIQSRLEMV